MKQSTETPTTEPWKRITTIALKYETWLVFSFVLMNLYQFDLSLNMKFTVKTFLTS